MKHFVLLLTTMVSTYCFAQQKHQHPSASPKKSTQVGINFSPDLSSRSVRNTLLGSMQKEYESAKIGFTTGLNICFALSNAIGLESGIQYSNKGYEYKNPRLIFEQPDPSQPVAVDLNYSYDYIDIPLKVNATFG